MKKPKDLGIVIGTKDQLVWTKVQKEAKGLIEQSENSLIIQRAMLELATEKIKIETEK